MSEPSDEALLDQYFEGDAVAFKTFVRRHAGRVTAYAEAKGLRSEVAAEVAQEAFLRLHRSIHRYEKGRPALPWFFTIVHHLVVDAFRSARRIEDQASSEFLDSLPGAVAAGSGETGVRLLERLNPDQRRVMELRVLEGLTFTEMAQETGKTETSLRKVFERARARLRAVLKSEG